MDDRLIKDCQTCRYENVASYAYPCDECAAKWGNYSEWEDKDDGK